MGRSQLWFARVLRLSGIALVILFLATVSFGLIAGYADPTGVSWHLFVIIALASIPLMFLGVLMSWIGQEISPPDLWLDPWLSPFKGRKRNSSTLETYSANNNLVWAAFQVERPAWTLGPHGRCSVEFEDGHLFLGQQGKDLVMIEPKTIRRTTELKIEFDTGRWNNRRVTLFFDSVSDADEVEQKAKKLLLSSQEVSG